jgi:transposase, IS5 family
VYRKRLRRIVKWRTGSEGRISYLKRGYGWDHARIDRTEGTRIWSVLAHNLVKISAHRPVNTPRIDLNIPQLLARTL